MNKPVAAMSAANAALVRDAINCFSLAPRLRKE